MNETFIDLYQSLALFIADLAIDFGECVDNIIYLEADIKFFRNLTYIFIIVQYWFFGDMFSVSDTSQIKTNHKIHHLLN